MHFEEGVGLVCAGGVGQSFLARMPALLQRLGPIKTSVFRLSRQVANTLRAGRAVSHHSALESCKLILVRVPEARLDSVLRELVARAPIRQTPFCSNIVVLCDCVRDSLAPSALLGTGARVATLNPIPDSGERIFVAEGHPAAVRHLRVLLAENQRKLIGLRPGAKPLFFAGIHAGAPLLLPWIAAGMACLRAAGFSRPEAAVVGEILGVRVLRKYAKAGAKVWSRITAAELRAALEHGVPVIRARDPRLADLYEQGIRVALSQFKAGTAEKRPPASAESRASSDNPDALRSSPLPATRARRAPA
jgi:hypothetical protein